MVQLSATRQWSGPARKAAPAAHFCVELQSRNSHHFHRYRMQGEPVKTLTLIALVLVVIALPIAAVFLIRWTRSRQEELRQRFGRWTENQGNILARQARQRGDTKSALKWTLLTPVVTKHERLARATLWLAVVALVMLSALLVLPAIFEVFTASQKAGAIAANQPPSLIQAIIRLQPNISAHADKQHQVATSRRVLPAGSLRGYTE